MSRWLPPAASMHAAEIDLVVTLVHGLALALFVGWAVYFTWVLMRFRRSRQPVADPRGAGSRVAFWIEAGVVIAEVGLLVAIALPVWYERTSARPVDTSAVVIRVVGEQFVWNVHYPGLDGEFGTTAMGLITASNPLGLDRSSPHGADDLTLVNEIHLPMNRQVVVQLSSKDVIHSFGVPAMRVKQDAIPGVVTSTWFTPIAAGSYDVACSQLCGLAHFRMRAVVTVESEGDYRAFVARETAALR